MWDTLFLLCTTNLQNLFCLQRFFHGVSADYVGTIKAVARIYQQTFLDTYTKVAFVKVYDRKNHCGTKARHTQTNSTWVRFHRTIQEEFYATTFRKKLYTNLKELQANLDDWPSDQSDTSALVEVLLWQTPMQTFLDSVSLAREKILDSLSTPAPESEPSPAQQ
jgi:glycyl-tRNA synthetase beta subunit